MNLERLKQIETSKQQGIQVKNMPFNNIWTKSYFQFKNKRNMFSRIKNIFKNIFLNFRN
jgi:hypothetical protein